jgi:hypothetical protein
MRNLPRDLLSSWLAVLLASSVACTKANFVRVTDGTGGVGGAGVSGGAGDSGVVDGGGGVGDSADAGAGGSTGDSGAAGDSGLGPDVKLTCPAVPVPACVPSTTGPCDPVCQTGSQTGSCDWCTQKCTYAPAGAAAQPTCAGKGKQTVFQPCGVVSSGSAIQNDNCAPGSICLQPVSGDNSWYCFSLCRSTIDCISGVECGQRNLYSQGPLITVCDPPYDSCGPDGKCCDPFAAQAASGCATNRFCLLVSPDPATQHSRTVCEFSYGNGRHGDFCDSAHACLTANACVNGFCRQVCNTTTNPCPSPLGTCMPWGAEYGYCPD